MESKRFRSAVSILVCLALVAIAGGGAHAEKIDGIVAVVDDTIIMVSDLEERMKELGAPADSKKVERQVLELMVEDIVVRKIYTSLGLPPVSEQEAQDLSEKSGMTVRDAGSYIRKAALMEMMVRSRVVVTENMIRNHYENQPQYRGRDSVRLNQILIRKDSAKAARALDELNAGKPFAEVAGRYSDVLSSGSADIGWVAVEDLSEELRASMKAEKPGDRRPFSERIYGLLPAHRAGRPRRQAAGGGQKRDHRRSPEEISAGGIQSLAEEDDVPVFHRDLYIKKAYLQENQSGIPFHAALTFFCISRPLKKYRVTFSSSPDNRSA